MLQKVRSEFLSESWKGGIESFSLVVTWFDQPITKILRKFSMTENIKLFHLLVSNHSDVPCASGAQRPQFKILAKSLIPLHDTKKDQLLVFDVYVYLWYVGLYTRHLLSHRHTSTVYVAF